MPKATPVSTDDIRKLLDQVPLEDESLIVLKGHLIAEQLVRRYLELMSDNPKPVLDINRLPFTSLIAVAQSYSKASASLKDLVWVPLGLLNTLRNWMAHDLDSSSHAKHIAALIQHYERLPHGSWQPREYRGGSRTTQLRFAVVGILQALAGAVMAIHTGKLTKKEALKYLGQTPSRPRSKKSASKGSGG
jgi:hypothetical protein